MTELGKNISLSGQCFPVRSLTRHNVFEETTGGAWLVAYKAEQRRRFKAVLCREPDVALPVKSSVSKQSFKSSKEVEEEETRRKLDGFYLMKVCCVNDPLDLCSINISGRGLNQVNEEDFSLFKNVLHIDAGDNNLQLMHFRTFSCLKELELPLNNLSGTINIDEKDFSSLETLDLSCNNLTNNDILALGILPALKVLHLTGNRLKELPPEMSRSYLLNKRHRNSRFACLEKLWLDQNDLADTNTFTSLAGLKRLKYLNLEHNRISSVPHLKLLEPKTNVRLSSNKYFPKNTPEADKDPKLTLGGTPNVDKVLDSELADVNNKISSLEGIVYNDKNEEEKAINNAVKDEASNFINEYLKGLRVLPFPSLQHLNLANNRIEEEEGLLALSTWPSVEELVIWGNPVASRGKEGPPVVAYHLGILSGIQVTRHKPSKKDEKKNLTPQTFIKHPRRVQDLPPVAPNRRLLMLDAPKYPEISCGRPNEVKPLPPITAPCKKSRNRSPKRVSSAPAKEQSTKSRHISRPALGEDSRDSARSKLRSNEFHGPVKTNGEPSSMETPRATTPRHGESPSPEDRVFLTQVDDVDNEELLFFNDDEPKKTVEEEPVDNGAKPTVVDKKYKGYEDLLNIDEEYPEDIKLPTNIHSNVRALQYVLDHPLIFTEHSGKHRTSRKTKPNEQRTITQKSSRTTTVEELGIILEKMRTHSKTVESNLDDVLKDSENQRIKTEFKEAKKLLNEVQTKYNEVRCQSLSSTAMAADIMQKELSNSLPGLSQEGKKQKTCQENDKIKSANDLKKFKERLDSRI